jgi:hypothetical protein
MVILSQEGRPELVSDGGRTCNTTEIYEWGAHLARTAVGVNEDDPRGLWNAKGWKDLVEHMPPEKQPYAAILLENARRKFGRLDEVTRTQNLGTFDKWIFPIIANMAENDVIDQLVSVQPMAGPVSQIVYMDIVTDRRKGRIPQGAPMWRATQGASDRDADADELIQGETGYITSASNSTDLTKCYTVDWTPIRPGTVQITIGSYTAIDDGNGKLVASGNISAGWVDYANGKIWATDSSDAASGATCTVTYQYNSEGNQSIMGYEMKLTSTPVTAKVMKLKAVWSEEADQNLSAMYNIGAEPTIVNSITNALQYQKHRQVIFDLRARADAGFVSWDATPPSNTNYQTHKFSFNDAVQTASMFIFGATNQATGNWLLLGLQPATVVVTLPQFVARANRVEMQGITYIGDLADKKVFADPHYPNNEWLVGFRGRQFVQTGFVLAEYQKLYTTPDIMLPDFLHQRGFATSFAKKMVNSKMFCRGLVQNAPTNFGSTIG